MTQRHKGTKTDNNNNKQLQTATDNNNKQTNKQTYGTHMKRSNHTQHTLKNIHTARDLSLPHNAPPPRPHLP